MTKLQTGLSAVESAMLKDNKENALRRQVVLVQENHE